MRIAGYEPATGQRPVVVLTFDRQVAVVPRCGVDWDDLSATASNSGFTNFGCANAANMAAQIAYPGDLISPQVQTPPDAGRRQTVLDNYRKGQPTSTAKDAQASGAVSSVVQ